MRCTFVIVALGSMVLASCGGEADTGTPETNSASYAVRMEEIDQAVAAWRTATSIEAAHQAAEKVANLIVGPNGPGYGDRDGDGAVQGETTTGVLRGVDGMPTGIADALSSNQCVINNVLGGDWDDPEMRWQIMLDAIGDWEPGNNTMPTLPSHPMRVVGWATFTLDSESLDEAHEYAGHAKLHVDISLRALDC